MTNVPRPGQAAPAQLRSRGKRHAAATPATPVATGGAIPVNAGGTPLFPPFSGRIARVLPPCANAAAARVRTMLSPYATASYMVICLAAPVWADDAVTDNAPTPDKSSYTLFNPTPDADLRDFSPDRPTKLNGPYTIDAGHFEYEADVVNWTYDYYNSARVATSSLVIADPTFKVGLTNRTDFEVALAPVNIYAADDRNTGTDSTVAGFGDIFARVKFNLFGNDGGDYALAVVPYVKLPTASHFLGNQHWEGGGYMPFQIALPENWSLTMQTEVDYLVNTNLDGMHTSFQNAISIAHPLFYDTLTAAVDFWSLVDGNKGAKTQYTADASLALAIGKNLQLDGGVNIGLNKAAPDIQAYLGISQRF